LATGEREVAEAEGVRGDQVEQFRALIRHIRCGLPPRCFLCKIFQ
jgi:hypothetical protein